MPKPWEEGAHLRQRVAPAVAALVVVVALIYTMVPFTFAGIVHCSAPLGGSQPAPDTPAGVIPGNVDEACADSAGGRLVTAGVIAAAAVVIGLAGAFLPSEQDEAPERDRT